MKTYGESLYTCVIVYKIKEGKKLICNTVILTAEEHSTNMIEVILEYKTIKTICNFLMNILWYICIDSLKMYLILPM